MPLTEIRVELTLDKSVWNVAVEGTWMASFVNYDDMIKYLSAGCPGMRLSLQD
jgi:hypothetical protein